MKVMELISKENQTLWKWSNDIEITKDSVVNEKDMDDIDQDEEDEDVYENEDCNIRSKCRYNKCKWIRG